MIQSETKECLSMSESLIVSGSWESRPQLRRYTVTQTDVDLDQQEEAIYHPARSTEQQQHVSVPSGGDLRRSGTACSTASSLSSHSLTSLTGQNSPTTESCHCTECCQGHVSVRCLAQGRKTGTVWLVNDPLYRLRRISPKLTQQPNASRTISPPHSHPGSSLL
ncbi:unnamed protein product [Pleuronectes platessa]|uniref:Uncharacterized protein n=1 Tax=Pleuronectes platessa TaxID=8262 RepID=A0A9N7TMF0_PLEPL|nr:unnamed protein product [Pleuronectes platessa]